MRRILLALAALLLAVPAFPSAVAQSSASPYVALYDDSFDAEFGWVRSNADPQSACSTGAAVPVGQTCWFRVADGSVNSLPRMVWFAARLNETGAPSGYNNDRRLVMPEPPEPPESEEDLPPSVEPPSFVETSDEDAVLRSREILIPEGVTLRSIRVALKGSSEPGADTLRLQWALGGPDIANQWETIREWSGSELAGSYRIEEAYSASLAAARGAITVRFVFDSDTQCDSNPGNPVVTPNPDNLPSLGFDPTTIPGNINPGDPTAGETPTYEGEVPTPDPSPGDPANAVTVRETDAAMCVDTDPSSPDFGSVPLYDGWFIDHVQVVARRDFVFLAGPSAPRLAVLAHQPAATEVDLIADRGKVLEFTVDETRFNAGPFSAMNAVLAKSPTQRLAVTMAKTGASTWSGLLAVDEPELVTGTWQVTFVGQESAGPRTLAVRSLVVEAADQVPPQLLVAGASPTSVLRLGPGDTLTLTVLDPLLRRVTYTYPGLPAPLEMMFPYMLPEAALPEGVSEVTLAAVDRVGLTATQKVTVDRDTVAPILALNATAVLYAGVPFDLGFQVLERSAHLMRVDINGTTYDFPFAAGQAATTAKTTTLRIVPPGVGPLTVSAVVNDTMGNEARIVRQFTAVPPVTDLRVASLLVETPATNTAREGQVLAATLQQVGGVAPLPVTVVFEASRNTYVTPATVPATGNLVVRWNATLPPGLHEVRVRILPPEVVNETLPGNEELSTPIEVFLGRVTVDGQVYAIRSDGRGLPTSVLVVGTSRTLPLDLVDSEGGVGYRFTAAGDREVTWDPLQPVVELEDSPDPEDGKKDAPFPGLLMALAAMALAFVARRRKA